MPFQRTLLLVLVLSTAASLHAETVVVPFWATSLPGSDGTWWSQVVAVNPNAFPVSFRVTRVFPFTVARCESCSGESTTVTLEPRGSAIVRPPSGIPHQRLVAGGFQIEATGPLQVHSVAYRPGASEVRQRLDVARRWLPAGHHAVSTVERGGTHWRMNLFIVNPTDRPLHVTAWTHNRSENERDITVAPMSVGILSLPVPQCGGVPCPFPTGYPPAPVRVEYEADGEHMASVSSVDEDWAVFSIADGATH